MKLTCGGIYGEGAGGLVPRDSIEVELVYVGRSQVGHCDLIGVSFYGQLLRLSICILVVDQEGIKGPAGDSPMESDRITCDIDNRELPQAELGRNWFL